MPELPTNGVPFDRTRLTRRGFMVAGIAGGLTLAGCSQSRSQVTGSAAQMSGGEFGEGMSRLEGLIAEVERSCSADKSAGSSAFGRK